VIDPCNIQRSFDNVFQESTYCVETGQKNQKYLKFLTFIEKTLLGLKKQVQAQQKSDKKNSQNDVALKLKFENALSKQLQNPEMRKSSNAHIREKIKHILDKS